MGPNTTNEWEFLLESGGATPAVAGTAVGPQPTLVAGTTYHVALTWNGTVYTFWLGGVSKGTLTAGKPAVVSQALTIGANTGGGNPITGTVDEIRISNSCRYTTGFVPPTAPFTSDANTEMLYHLDAIVSANTVNLARWEEVIIVEAPGSSTPTVTDANGIAYPVTVVTAGGLWWAPIPSANGTPLTVSTSATGTAVLKSKNPYLA